MPSEPHVLDEKVLVHLPTVDRDVPDQDAEWCDVETPEGLRRLRFHDYDELFKVPGLYELLFYETLKCNSPEVVRGLLEDVLEDRGRSGDDLVLLDVGAGNGMVAEEIAELGAKHLVGVDILPEAAMAAERDRPDLYDAYHVVDLTDVPEPDHSALSETPFNCMTTVAALGFGDIPPEAFAQAYDYVDDGGLVAFTLRDRFCSPREDESGFAKLMRELKEAGRIDVHVEHRYQHRLSVAGDPLYYICYVAEKRGDATISDKI